MGGECVCPRANAACTATTFGPFVRGDAIRQHRRYVALACLKTNHVFPEANFEQLSGALLSGNMDIASQIG
jgi:hypothetical protein